MQKFILIVAAMVKAAIGAELDGFFTMDNLFRLLGASDEPDIQFQNTTRHGWEWIYGSDTLPEGMKLKDDIFHSGYAVVDNYDDQDMFYMLFESRNSREKDPLVIWIRGEQGCSASADLFSPLGPYQFKINETTGGIPSLEHNPDSWNEFANLMILDAQIGTGYSFVRSGDKEAAWDMEKHVRYFTRFMKQFYARHSDFRGRDTYIVGQDFFGGKMIPLFVDAIWNIDNDIDDTFSSPFLVNNVSPNQKYLDWIKIRGVALGSPVIDEANIRDKAPAYALDKGLVTEVYEFFFKYVQDWLCKPTIGQKSWAETAFVCGATESFATGNPIYPIFDIRNINQECQGMFTCQKNDGFGRFAMNQKEVKKLFQVNTNRSSYLMSSLQGNWRWTECNKWDGFKIKDNFLKTEVAPNTTDHMARMLQRSKQNNLKVLVYVGELDYRVNWMGLEAVVDQLQWYGEAELNEDSAHNYKDWYYWSPTKGHAEVGGGYFDMDDFTFLKIKDAGLKVHRERPELMNYLLKQWMGDLEGKLR